MSGTSLDGLDLALCEFESTESGHSFKILSAETIDYGLHWRKRLTDAKLLSLENYFELHSLYGQFIAKNVNGFLKKSKFKPSLIASHGHTIFHQPQRGFSVQLGCGATIAAHTGISTVYDFRSLDVALAGQGAPLVPIGDKLLFGNYQACLNIGGIANISFDDKNGNRLAYDICVANMLLNFLSEKTGKAFDENGDLAKSGKINASLLKTLNQIDFYSQTGAKSLGREWFEKYILHLLPKNNDYVPDLLATATEHIAQIIANELNSKKIKNVLVTGGGALNNFLIEGLRAKTKSAVIIPSKEIINFKEALIFAFLGYLRVNETTNVLKSFTGASTDSIAGSVYII